MTILGKGWLSSAEGGGDIDTWVDNSLDIENGDGIYKYRQKEDKFLDLGELGGGDGGAKKKASSFLSFGYSHPWN